jgi:N-acetylneuraminic acid mutarotase
LHPPAAVAGRARQILALAVACLVAAGVAGARSVADASAEQDMAGSWTQLASAGSNRQEVSFTEAGGKLYLFGGSTTERQQAYTPATNAWADTAAPPNVPGKLDHVQGVTVGSRIFYIGGLTAWPSPDIGTVQIYDTVKNEWSTGAGMGERRRGAGGVATYNGKIYYAGGIHDGQAVNWLDEYDPNANTWRRLPDMPTARDHFAAAVLDGKLWAIGGRGGPNAINSPTGVNQAYDFATGTWSTGHAPLPTPRGGFAAAALGCEIIIIGGEGRGPFEGAY